MIPYFHYTLSWTTATFPNPQINKNQHSMPRYLGTKSQSSRLHKINRKLIDTWHPGLHCRAEDHPQPFILTRSRLYFNEKSRDVPLFAPSQNAAFPLYKPPGLIDEAQAKIHHTWHLYSYVQLQASQYERLAHPLYLLPLLHLLHPCSHLPNHQPVFLHRLGSCLSRWWPPPGPRPKLDAQRARWHQNGPNLGSNQLPLRCQWSWQVRYRWLWRRPELSRLGFSTKHTSRIRLEPVW